MMLYALYTFGVVCWLLLIGPGSILAAKAMWRWTTPKPAPPVPPAPLVQRPELTVITGGNQ